MKDHIINALEELKRIDHLVYVTLKYTRTVDVLINIMKRMIEAYEFIFDGILLYAKEKKRIDEVPSTPKEKCEFLKSTYPDAKIHENIDLYMLLRKLVKTSFERENEYRRHVTMITYMEGKQEIINIDIITQYYQMQREFLVYAQKMMKEND